MFNARHLVRRIALLAVLALPAIASAQTTFTVTVGPKTAANPYFGRGEDVTYYINGEEAPRLTLTRGQTYTFQMSNVSAFHPFYISLSDVGSGAGQYDVGVTGNNATGNNVLTFTPDLNAPDFLFYQCSNHDYMGWEILLTGVAGANEDASAVAAVSVGPNPATDRALVTMSAPVGAHATLVVVDLLGREVARLFDGVSTTEAPRQFALDAGSLAPGTYEARLTADGVSTSTRVVVAR